MAAGFSAVTAAPAAAASLPVGTGPVPGGSFLRFNLTDRLQAVVNVGSGNLLVRSTDLVLPGIEGNVVLGADYNSLNIGSSIETGAFGHGWRSRSGIDVRLIANSDGTVTFTGPDGVVGTFTPVTGTSNYTSPGVFKATLVKTSSGWNLTDHNSGSVIAFKSSGKPSTITDRNGNVVTVTYNASGQQTKITSDWGPAAIRTGATAYGSNGFISSYTQTGTDATTHTVGYGYDSAGNLTSITDPDGNQYVFGYDSAHNLTSITTPTVSTDPSGPDDVTTFTYDSSHRVTSITRQIKTSASGAPPAVTRLSYVSSTETQVAEPNTDQTLPVASVPNYTYTLDSQQRVTQVTDPAGNSSSFTYNSFNDVKTFTDALTHMFTNTYGANSSESLTNAATPMGASTSFAYANAPTTINPTANFEPSSYTDPQGNATAYGYNGAGNLASAKNALAAQSSVGYNNDGTVSSSTDPMNGTNSTTYAYNTDHQLTTVTPPTGNNLAPYHYTYDAFGRPLTVTDGAGREATFGYDADGRVTSVTFNDGTIAISYTYDGSGNLIQRTDESGTTSYTYDLANQLLTRHNTADGKTLLYTYDLDGNLASVDDDRGTTTYTYNFRDLLTSMTTQNGTLYTFNYNKDEQRTDTFFNTVSGNTTWAAHTRTSYDNSGRITRITTAVNSTPANLVFDTSYCYSPFVSGQSCPTSSSTTDTGLVQYATNNMTGTVSVYSYDQANRLTGATNVAGHTYGYTYDADGNRTSVKTDGTTTQSLGYNSANQITSSGYSYDGAGNMTASPGATYTYNAAREMSSSTVNGTTAAHVYAGGTQQELTFAGTNQFIWGHDNQYGQPWLQSFNTGGGSQVFVERDASGTPLGLHIAGLDYYLVTDNQGSVVAAINTSGNAVAHYTYDPYGNTVTADESGLQAPNIIRYTGGALDQTTGLLKLGQRYYDPAIGAFTQQDANQILANPSNGNLYAYAADNPATFTDPTGRCSGIFGCVWTVVTSAAEFTGIGAAGGGAVGYTIAGGPFDPLGCVAAGGTGAAIGGFFGWWFGVGWGIAKAQYGP